MFQNKKLKRNATYASAEVAEVPLCSSNCALTTSVIKNNPSPTFTEMSMNCGPLKRQFFYEPLISKFRIQPDIRRTAILVKFNWSIRAF